MKTKGTNPSKKPYHNLGHLGRMANLERKFLGQATSLEKLRRNPRAPSQGDVPQFAKVTRMKGNGLS